MDRTDRWGRLPKTWVLISAVAVVASLYFARVVLIPCVLAVLLGFFLTPLATRLEDWGLPRWLSTLLVVALLVGSVVGTGWIVAGQAADVATRLPEYRENLERKLGPVRAKLGAAAETVQKIGEPVPAGEAVSKEEEKPPKVQVVPTTPSAFEFLMGGVGWLLPPLTTSAVSIVLVAFILLQREDLRDRLLRLLGAGRVHLTTQAMDEAAGRVSRYLVTQTLINAGYGAILAVGFALLGLRSPILWGLICALLRFVPYIGVWVGIALPFATAVAEFPGWTKPLLVAGLFAATELAAWNIVEPFLQGARTGLSPVAVLVSALFWAWLWGPAGLLLAIPLTVCLVVLGRYVVELEFLSVLLGDEPVLAADVRLYQRLLVLDQEEAMELVEAELEERPFGEVCDRVLLPALSRMRRDRWNGFLDEAREARMIESLREIVAELLERRRAETAGTPKGVRPLVVLLPALDAADELAASFLAEAAERVEVEILKSGTLASEVLEHVERRQPQMACVSSVQPAPLTPSRYLCKRITTRLPELPILVCAWNARPDARKLEVRLGCPGVTRVVSSLAEAVEQVREWKGPPILPNGGDPGPARTTTAARA
jgi:predicted PurR-regulated permease PerM